MSGDREGSAGSTHGGQAELTGGSVLVPVNPIAANHAEHVALENLWIAIEAAIGRGKLKREELDGRCVIMRVEQEPCSSCATGLKGDDLERMQRWSTSNGSARSWRGRCLVRMVPEADTRLSTTC
jgi:hypothetical protein